MLYLRYFFLCEYAYDKDSKWLITVESRGELSGVRTSCLKFWERGEKYVLKTMVDPPHVAAVTSLCATKSLAVTAAGDEFKVWAHTSGDDGLQWSCSVAGSFMGVPCSFCALTTDESLLAAAFGPVRPFFSFQ